MGVSGFKLLKSVMLNSRYQKMNRDLIGFKVREPVKPVTKQEVSDFMDATDSHKNLKTEGTIPPFFMTKLIIPVMKKIWIHKDLNMNILKMVHAEQIINCHHTLRTGGKITREAEITDIQKTSAGELITIASRIEQDNRLCIEGISCLMVRAGKSLKKKRAPKEIEKESFCLEIPTWDGQQLKYARVSDDNNFIHTNHFLAKLAGLPRTVMHGTCVMTMCTNALCGKLTGHDITKMSSSGCRFSKPAIPGDTLLLKGYVQEEKGSVHYSTYGSDGSKVLSKGIFIYKS